VKSSRKLAFAVLCGLTLVAILGGLLIRGRVKRVAKAWVALGAPAKTQTYRPLEELAAAEVLYDGKLGDGWSDWGWGPHRLGNGPAQIVFQGFGGILFQHPPLPSQYAGVAFRFKAPPAWGEFMHVALRSTGTPDSAFPLVPLERRHIAQVDAEWREALVDWSELNPQKLPFDRVMIGSFKSVGDDWVRVDRVLLTTAAGAPASAPKERTDRLAVKCEGGRPVSDLIYGASSESWGSGQSAIRMGGNPLSRYNWALNAWNVGSDWFFENVSAGTPLHQLLATRARDQRRTALVVPMLGWVAKDTTSSGFPRSKFDPQRKYDQYRPEAGDGARPDGSLWPPGSPEQTSVAAPPELIEKWVREVAAADAARGGHGIGMYILDNEPSLWNVTHRDVHPQPVGYDELLDRTIKYATAIRNADRGAVIAGPAEWGWTNYEYSAVDREAGVQSQPDRRAHGGVALVPWYLKKLAEHERTTGQPLLDVLDLHFYPAADGVYGGNARTDPASAALRVRSTRSLWDPTYYDESWIKEAIALIPRMRNWVRDNHPGLKLSIGEWNFGAEDHISGGLATAEALGRFGQQGLDAAFFWGDLKEGTPAYWAFRAFRNFDGKGARFLDVSIPVQESAEVSVFASRDVAQSQLVVVLVNRAAATSVDATVALQGCGRRAATRLFSYAGAPAGLAPATFNGTANEISTRLEPASISVLEVRLEAR